MQKKLKSLFMVASFVAAATLVFIACGNGVGEKITGELDNDIFTSKGKIEKDIEAGNFGSTEPVSSEAISSSSQITPPHSSSSIASGTSSSAPPIGGNSSSTTGTQSSSSSAPPRSSSSAPVQATGCKASASPRPNYTCGWNITGILTPGTILKPKDPAPPSGCSAVKWKYAPGTSAMILNNECAEVPADGFAALGSKNYVLFAELTCDGTNVTTACDPKEGLSSKVAPILDGECKWAKNPTTTARGGIPSGVSVVDTDHICTSPTVEYKYANGTKDWPKTGLLDEWKDWKKKDTATYNVEATLKCTGYPATVTSACPPLKVSAESDHLIECTCVGDAQCQVEANICKADGAEKSNKVTLTKDECVEVYVYGYNNPHYMPEVGMRCQTSNNTSFTVTVNGKSTTVAGNGLIPIGKLAVQAEINLGTLCLTTDNTITCTGPGQ